MTKFKRMRKKLGLSQDKMARQLGISTSTVVGYEREPTDKVMSQMKTLLDGKIK